jgi:UDP:flavonoid glycosyltransferase YjiC (YdhE family)
LIAALSLGVPVVVLPMGADQPDNADRCEVLGVGLVLDAMSADPATIAGAVETVTRDWRFARAAAALAAEASAQSALANIGELHTILDRR